MLKIVASLRRAWFTMDEIKRMQENPAAIREILPQYRQRLLAQKNQLDGLLSAAQQLDPEEITSVEALPAHPVPVGSLFLAVGFPMFFVEITAETYIIGISRKAGENLEQTKKRILKNRLPVKRFWKDFQPALFITLAISFLLTLYGPLELFFTNMDEFHFSAFALLPQLLKLFLLVTAAGLLTFLFCHILCRRLYDVALIAAVIGYLCTYIQGMFLSGSLPPLDGERIPWGAYTTQHIASLLLWFVVGVIVTLLVRFLHMKKMYRIITACSVFFSAVLLVTVTAVCIQNDGISHRQEAAVTNEAEFQMSTEQNFVIFVLDAVDSATFHDMLRSDAPEFRETLSDFTYYPNTVGAYVFTKHSIPYILHGKRYENQEDFHTFTTDAMTQSPLLNTLRTENYRMGLYEEDLFYDDPHIHDFENIRDISCHISDFRSLPKAELKLVWFKYAPYPLKKFVQVDMEVFSRILQPDEDVTLFRFNNGIYYRALQEAQVETVPDKCFRFIHIEGAHVPFRYNKDVDLIDQSEGSYPQNIACAMTIFREYLSRLKSAGVYDNTAIILMSDHGYGYEQEIPLVGRCNPLLAVKGIGEHHDMNISDAPISYDDLQDAYQMLLGGASGDQVFDAREGQQRSRKVLLYENTRDNHMVEYEQTGHASDIETLTPTGRVFDYQGG